MAARFFYALDGVVLEEFLDLTVRDRRQLLKIFHQLAGNPYQKGESIFLDLSDREIQTKHFDQWQVSFWSDHAVKEVRIVGVRRFKR